MTTAPAKTAVSETITVTETTVACDGGGALGHPTVYLEVGARGEVTCPYCSRHFKLDANAPQSAAH